MKRILTIVGPTATGKTELALNIARQTSGEILSADSRQIYRYLDIGTAKPDRMQRDCVPFHLIDVVDPDENYSCGQFARDAEQVIARILQKDKLPIVCGGTGLYIRALFEPLHDLPPSDKRIKARLLQLLRERGTQHLYERLCDVDPSWAGNIAPNDTQRIIRGLEVYELTATPLSALVKKKRKDPVYLPYYTGLNLPREELYDRINKRYDRMIANGLVNEVQWLLEKGYDPRGNALRTLGYKEIIEHVEGKITLHEAVEKAKQHTRNFAKRQMTWFSRLKNIQWFDARDPHLIAHLVSVVRSKIR